MTAAPTKDVAFRSLYLDSYATRLGHVATLVGGNVHDAEDILQEAFLDLYTAWDKAERPPALLTTITRRKVMRHWSRGNASRQVLVAAVPDKACARDDPAVLAEQRDLIRRELAAMTPLEREVVALRAADIETKDIALLPGVTEEKVLVAQRTLLRRAAPPIMSPNHDRHWSALFAELSEQQRKVMTLAYNKGLHPKTIALNLGISENCARVHLSHAKKRLAELMPEPAEEAAAIIHRVLRLHRAIGGLPTWNVDGAAIIMPVARVTYAGQEVDFDERGRLKAGKTLPPQAVRNLDGSDPAQPPNSGALPKRIPGSASARRRPR